MANDENSISTPVRNISGQAARFKRLIRAVAEGERLERENAGQHDAHVRAYIRNLFDLIRAAAKAEGLTEDES